MSAPPETTRRFPSRWRRFLRVLKWSALALFSVFIALTLILRYAILPEIHRYKTDIETAASAALGQQVEIDRLEARWSWTNPTLTLENVRLVNPPALQNAGRNGLVLKRIEGVLSWQSLFSLWRGQPCFTLLVLERPALQIRRNARGEVFVAGIPVSASGADTRGLSWLLAQSRIRVWDATITWEDAMRDAPPLILEDVRFELQNQGSRHRFGFSARPPEARATRLDIRGDLRGNAEDTLKAWRGTLYGRLDQTDLASWRAWIDSPVALSQGRGGLRFWLRHKNGEWKGTADILLRDLRLRLEPGLPELDLARLDGRISFTRAPGALGISTRRLSLATRDGLEVEPLTFTVNWRKGDARTSGGEQTERIAPGQGSLSANAFDLEVLATLAACLPLDAESHALLARYRPRGKVRQLKAHWEIDGGVWKKYRLKADFSDLGLTASGVLPGATGLSGNVRMEETGGRLALASRNATLSLPAVFAEAEIPLTRLDALVAWKSGEENGITMRIQRLAFQSPHAEGRLSGQYRSLPGLPGRRRSPGFIDLEGSLSRAQATAVWRYLPKVVHANVPRWLRQSLVAGHADNVRLALKGDLAHFPFRDPRQGVFRITAKAHDVTLRYDPGWPEITRINADLSFGAGMEIQATLGMISGARIEEARVAIADFSQRAPLLTVRGRVAGEMAHFLRFIADSPVAGSINRFTDGMRAQGRGRLDLALDMPLTRVANTRVTGHYFLEGNQIHFMPGLPPAADVRGDLAFTRDTLTIPGLTGHFLGLPMRLSGTSEDGGFRIKASGGMTAQALRRTAGASDAWRAALPLLDAVSGQTAWQADIAVKEQSGFTITSTLQGLAFNLPSPFAKTTDDALPLEIRKATLERRGASRRERIDLSLGTWLRGTFLKRDEGAQGVLERGFIGVGAPPRALPDQGVTIAIAQDRLNLDDWRRFLAADANVNETATTTTASGHATLPINRIDLDARELVAFGHTFANAGIRLTPGDRKTGSRNSERNDNKAGRHWKITIDAREAQGEIAWDDTGKGRLVARLGRLSLSPDTNGKTAVAATPDAARQDLPSMAVSVGEFSVGTCRLGHLKLLADNVGGHWNLRQVEISNPDGKLTGHGVWESATTNRTRLDFSLAATDAGKLLGRLGYANMVQGGAAQLGGQLAWVGNPARFDASTLTGKLRLTASNGQFSRVDPGVGKLLGLLSLNAITRRLSLDFRDIFSNGFAFDSIDADLELEGGILKTRSDLRINGPSGEVLMRGTADMKTETQDLRVTVTPEVGGVAAMGAAIAINPAVGAAALLAQNLLKNPLNKAFRLRYHVTGHWGDPVVEKIGAIPANPRAPEETP
ncbi:MAG: TIGR02099 family protein [Zoogloeaceae bacterium]|nr:TIGR02099 family protein [Zoogloeaceae bacterium]